MDCGLFLFAGQHLAGGIQRLVGFANGSTGILFSVACGLFGLSGRVVGGFDLVDCFGCRIQHVAQFGQTVALL